MIEYAILGIVQGVGEWLPISSEGLIVFISSKFFSYGSLTESVKLALFLHLGTFFSALIYLRKDVFKLILCLKNFKRDDNKIKPLFVFLFWSTAISSVMAFLFLNLFEGADYLFEGAGKVVSVFIGLFLLITGYSQIKSKSIGSRSSVDLKKNDSVILGFVQGLASLPGLSRSGMTVSALLFRGFKEEESLRISFLMSLPIVFAGNIVLNFSDFSFSKEKIIALAFSFLFGLITIKAMIKIARSSSFGWFAIIFGLIMMGSFFV